MIGAGDNQFSAEDIEIRGDPKCHHAETDHGVNGKARRERHDHRKQRNAVPEDRRVREHATAGGRAWGNSRTKTKASWISMQEIC